jgi:sugar phosphate isomerase/epimerase
LQAGGAVLAGVLAARSGRAGEPADDFAGLRVGVQSYTFREFPVEQALKQTHDLGLSWIELYPKHAPARSTESQRKALLKLCREYKVMPVAFGVYKFTKDHEANRKVFDYGKVMGMTVFTADPDPDSFDSLERLVKEYQIAIAIHPHGPVGKPPKLHRWYRAEKIMEAVKDRDPLIGACLDTGHLIRAATLGEQLDPVQQIQVMGQRNHAIHLKDNDNARDVNVILGQGVLDVPGVLKALKNAGFKGCVAIEYEANPNNPAGDVRACLDVIRQAAKKLA